MIIYRFTWDSCFFRDEFNVKFSDNNACSSAKVVDPNAFQNTQTKDEKVMMNFYIIDYISSISEEDNNSIQTFIMYSTCQSWHFVTINQILF